MQFPTAKRSLKRQPRQTISAKHLKNHDRVIYVRGLFAPPDKQENPIGLAKETEAWRSFFTMLLVAGFGAVMLIISVVGNYGLLATYRLEEREQALLQGIESIQNKKSLMQEEVFALKTNPEYIELIARKELGLVRSGELIYYLPESLHNE